MQCAVCEPCVRARTGNGTVEPPANGTSTAATTLAPVVDHLLPQKGAAEEEHHSSMAIFFVLSVVGESRSAAGRKCSEMF